MSEEKHALDVFVEELDAQLSEAPQNPYTPSFVLKIVSGSRFDRDGFWQDIQEAFHVAARVNDTQALQSYKRELIEALEKWQHKDSSLNGYYEILNFIKQWEP